MRYLRNTLIIVTALALCACSQRDNDSSGVTGTSLRLVFETPTKAFPSGHEGAVNDVQMLLFHLDGSLYRYHHLTEIESSSGRTVILGLKPGVYDCRTIANAPSLDTVTCLAGYLNVPLRLEMNDTATGFVQLAVDTLEVKEGPNDLSVSLHRLCGRTTLKKVINAIPKAYDTLIIKRAFLMNVVGGHTLGGHGDTAYINRQGRAPKTPQEKGDIITQQTAECPGLTYVTINDTVANLASHDVPHRFYGYENADTTLPKAFDPVFTPQCTALCVEASFGGASYFYTIPLRFALRVAANTAAEVTLTILGQGGDDPEKPVPTGSFSAAVTIHDYDAGAVYVDEIK